MMDYALVLLAAGGELSAFTIELLKITIAAAMVAIIMQRLKLQLIPAYLICGVLLGATGLLSAPGSEQAGAEAAQAAGEAIEAVKAEAGSDPVSDVADLAIVLLLFGIGLHLDIASLRVGLRQMVTASLLAVVTSAAVFFPLTMLAGLRWESAAVVAMAASLSSTAVVLRLMQEQREMHRMTGRMSLAILVVQDILVVPMLLLVPILAKIAGTYSAASADAEKTGNPWMGVLWSVMGVTLIVLVGTFLMPRLLRLASARRGGSSEVLVVVALAFAMGCAAITQYIGLGQALGAFLGGFLLSRTAFKYALSGQIATIRDLAMAVFFVAIGTRLTLSHEAGFWGVVLIGFASLQLIKTVAIGLSCWASGLSARLSTVVGTTLAGAGEFGIVIMAVGASAQVGLIDAQTNAQWIAIVILCMLVNPSMLTLGRKLSGWTPLPTMAPWVRSQSLLEPEERGEAPDTGAATPKVIVAGFGVVGRAVVDRIERDGARAVVIEMNTNTVEKQQRRGRKIVFGDVSDPEVLISAGVHDASALILTVPDDAAVLRACTVARAKNPGLFIVARTSYLSRGMRAMSEGASSIVVEEMVTAEAMEKVVAEHCAIQIAAHAADQAGVRSAADDETHAGEPGSGRDGAP